MVDALRDACRVLSPSGILIDLRPMPTVFPVDVVGGSRAIQVAEVDATATRDDDQAADEAAASAVRRGWLVPQYHTEFDILYYWDTVAEMAGHLRLGRKEKRITPSYEDVDAALARASASIGHPAHLRSARRLALASYTKK